MAKKHVILVGLPGSGKSTVGRLAAELLGAGWVDLDVSIEQRAQKSVARIFAEDGEPAFRALEAELGDAVLAGDPVVMSPGGGFIADPTRRRHLLARGLVIYLETSAPVAAARARVEKGRPLLMGADPVDRMRELLRQREAGYLEAHEKVTTDALPAEAVARRVAELARARGGW
ncbi:MAG: shikimate kinase [Gemmatimonadetes bacterium]|nr:shikimate kinase [Gemmatimonadota bacterium]